MKGVRFRQSGRVGPASKRVFMLNDEESAMIRYKEGTVLTEATMTGNARS